jgi:hypothetical protein
MQLYAMALMVVRCLCALALLVLGGGVHAAGGTGEYALAWSDSHEVLRYRSCGCGDACWVAELRVRKTQRIKARLRCDCERLHLTSPWPGRERLYSDSCSVVNDSADKAAAIATELRQALQAR